ncbi:bactofilin family protein [Rubritalea marina]|uniref:bactofilin family protein n=1 Tax=Rubritalea marina TaxID=361055 RepID=UPI0003823286|nr:polymer-forming cytoskeletal protein [Rubritalea marina]
MSVFKKYINTQNEGAEGQTPSHQSAPVGVTPASTPESSSSSTQSSPAPSSSASSKVSNTSQLAAGSGRNMLSSDVEIKGRVRFANDLVVDGKIEGEIDSDGSLTVGDNARIRAEIRTRSVVIYGKVHGNIDVSDRVELKANAELVGDIKAGTLSIEAGAIFVGKSTVGAPSNQTSPAAKPAANSTTKPAATQKAAAPANAKA